MQPTLEQCLQHLKNEAVEEKKVLFFTLKVDGLREKNHFTLISEDKKRFGDFHLTEQKPNNDDELEAMSKEGLIEYIKDCRAIIKTDRLKDDGTVEELPLEDCIATVVRNWHREAELGVKLRNRLIEIGDPQASTI